MSVTWLYIILMELSGYFIVYMTPLLVYRPVVVSVNLILFIVSCILIRKDKRIPFMSNILFLVLFILIDTWIKLGAWAHNQTVSWLLFISLIIWAIWQAGRSRQI